MDRERWVERWLSLIGQPRHAVAPACETHGTLDRSLQSTHRKRFHAELVRGRALVWTERENDVPVEKRSRRRKPAVQGRRGGTSQLPYPRTRECHVGSHNGYSGVDR